MAQAKTITFGKAVVLLQDLDESALAFFAPCAIETLSMTINVESNTTNIPDCSDADLVAWLTTDIVSMQMTIEGEGALDTDAMKEWQDWYHTENGLERQVRFFKNLTALNGGGYYQGPAVLTAYSESGQRGQRWRQSFTIAFNGKPTWTAAV